MESRFWQDSSKQSYTQTSSGSTTRRCSKERNSRYQYRWSKKDRNTTRTRRLCTKARINAEGANAMLREELQGKPLMGKALSNNKHGWRWEMDLDPPDGFELPSISLMYTIRKASVSAQTSYKTRLSFRAR